MSAHGSLSQVSDVSRRLPTWPRVGVVVALLVLTVIVAKACQPSEAISQAEAIVLATEQVRFEPDPENTQIRFLRQGIDRHPFWIVSLSIGDLEGQVFDQLAVVRIDATSGDVVEVREQSAEDGSGNEEGSGAAGSGPGSGGAGSSGAEGGGPGP